MPARPSIKTVTLALLLPGMAMAAPQLRLHNALAECVSIEMTPPQSKRQQLILEADFRIKQATAACGCTSMRVAWHSELAGEALSQERFSLSGNMHKRLVLGTTTRTQGLRDLDLHFSCAAE
ncbi:DUF2195 family protein [Uliginosibacterium aquaticum]|uniref:DUF2195 family protein n=1 Tax=Uliginosibacterium aquaticum TaxID=2731212 RepID=A0ABX2IGX0_9RHOO|nr:DUF2195 family protein [Uliginosibacterium aquaticum]NSL55985.1 DUF2195 family protein [Uliginosibacterium aquaticum]